MLVPNQKVIVKWSSRNKCHFVNKGYEFTGIGKKFEVFAEDLMPKSSTKVLFYCDYCGAQHCKQMSAHSNKSNGKDCCAKCARIEQKNTCKKKYGVESKTQLPETRKKMRETCMKRYGKEYALQIEEVKERREKTCIDKFGCASPFSAESVKKQIKETCMQRYGVPFAAQATEVKDKIRENNLSKYGVAVPSVLPEVKSKMMQQFYENGNVPTSKIELQFVDKLKELFGENSVEQGYLYDWVAFDCLLTVNGIKIDCEWDGYYWHKKRKVQDDKRNKYLIHRGFKVLRVVSNHAFPSDEQILQGINELVNTDSTLKYIVLDV